MSLRQLRITNSITNRDSQSLEKYLQEIGRLEMIGAEEEVQLAREIRGGSAAAATRLVQGNLRFVVSVAKQYQFHGLPLPDLINEGNVGLIKAAQRFDETKGFKFISYAVWWIRQSIIQAITEQSRMVRLPSNKVGLSNRVQKAINQLEQELERIPSSEELSEVLKESADEIRLVRDMDVQYRSLDAPLGEDREGSLADLLTTEDHDPDADLVHHKSLRLEMMRCLRILPERERDVLCSFYGINDTVSMSLHEISQKYNLSPERVRQIKEKAIRHLKQSKKTSLLRSFL